MARGNQRDKAREKTQKEAASSVSPLRPWSSRPSKFEAKPCDIAEEEEYSTPYLSKLQFSVLRTNVRSF